MQPEINSIFNALHSQMSCYAATNTHDTPHNPLYNNINHSSSSPSSPPPPSSSSSLLFSSKQGEGRGEKRGSDGGGGGEEKAKSVDRHIESRHEASYEDSSCLRVSEKKEGKGGGDKRGEDEKRTIARQSSSSSFSTARRREGEEGERSENKEEDANRSHRAKTPDEEEVRRHCYEGDLPKNRMIEEKENTKTTDTVTPSLHLHSSSSSFPMQEECLRDCESHPSSSLLFEGGPHALYACERQGISLSSSSFTRDSSTRCSGEMVARGGNRPKSEEEGHQGRAIGAYFYKDEKKKKTDEDQEEEEEKISDRIRRRLEEERKKEIQKQMDSQQETKRKEIEKERKKEEENLMKKDKTEMSDDLDTSTFQDVYSTEEELHRASRLKREPLRQSQKEEEEGDQQLLSHSRGDHGKEEASLRGKDDGDRDGESRQMSSAVEEKKKERSEQDTDGEKKLSSVCSVEDLSSSSSSSPAVSFKAVDAHPLSSSSPPVDTPPRSFASSSSPSRLSHVVHPRDQEGGKGRSEDYRPEAICAVGSIEEHHEEEEELDSLLPSSQSPSRYHLSPSSPAQALLEDRQEDRRRPRRGPSSPSSPNAIKRRSEEERRGRRPSSQDLSSSIIMPVAPPSARTVLLRELTTALVTSGSFDARVQLLLSQFASDMLALNPLILVRLEHHLAADLLDLLKANTKEGARQKTWRRLKIAGAAIGGGFLVALTAGLAAPGIAAGIASLGLGGAGLSAFLASAGGMAVIVSLFGAGGAGLTGWKYSRRIANIKVFEFDMLNGKAPSSLCVTICVSGYLRTFDDISLPWIQALPHACSDLFSLKWEPNILKALGSMVIQMLSQ
ncbi:transmembrane protein, partial [Cystoisospora suis]